MDRRFKDAEGDEWYVFRHPRAGLTASAKGLAMRQPGFKFLKLTSSKMRFLKEEDAPKNLNLEKVDEDELRRLLDLATRI